MNQPATNQIDTPQIDEAFTKLQHTPMVELPEIGAVYGRARTRSRRQRAAVAGAGLACLSLLAAVVMGVTDRDHSSDVIANQSQTIVPDPTSESSTSATPTGEPSTSGSGTATANPSGTSTGISQPEPSASATMYIDYPTLREPLKQVAFHPGEALMEGIAPTGEVITHTSAGALVAYRADTGAQAWMVPDRDDKTFYWDEQRSGSLPLVVYSSSPRDQADSPQPSQTKNLVVRNSSSGKQLWHIIVKDFCDVVVRGNTLVVITNRALTAYDATTGRQRWTRATNTFRAAPEVIPAGQASGYDSTMALLLEEPGSKKPWLVQLSLAEGKLLHEVALPETENGKKVSFNLFTSRGGEVVLDGYVIGEGDLVDSTFFARVRASDGSLVWKLPTNAETNSDFDPTKDSLVESTGEQVTTYDLDSGRTLWTVAASGPVAAGNGFVYFIQNGASGQSELVQRRPFTDDVVDSVPIGGLGKVLRLTATDTGVVARTEKGKYIFAYRE